MSNRILILLPELLLALPIHAKEPVSYEVVQEIEMPRDRIFVNTLLWLAETAQSSKSVIELKDKELGTIVGNASVQISPFKWGIDVPCHFKIRIDVKENRYKLTFSQVRVEFDGIEKPIEQANRALLEPKVIDKFDELSASFLLYLKKANQSKSW